MWQWVLGFGLDHCLLNTYIRNSALICHLISMERVATWSYWSTQSCGAALPSWCVWTLLFLLWHSPASAVVSDLLYILGLIASGRLGLLRDGAGSSHVGDAPGESLFRWDPGICRADFSFGQCIQVAERQTQGLMWGCVTGPDAQLASCWKELHQCRCKTCQI